MHVLASASYVPKIQGAFHKNTHYFLAYKHALRVIRSSVPASSAGWFALGQPFQLRGHSWREEDRKMRSAGFFPDYTWWNSRCVRFAWKVLHSARVIETLSGRWNRSNLRWIASLYILQVDILWHFSHLLDLLIRELAHNATIQMPFLSAERQPIQKCAATKR